MTALGRKHLAYSTIEENTKEEIRRIFEYAFRRANVKIKVYSLNKKKNSKGYNSNKT